MAVEGAGRLIGISLDRIVGASARQRAALGRSLGLLERDVLALQHLLRAGELGPSELARRMPLSRAGTAAVVDRLCKAGLVSRDRDPRDQRRAILRATPAIEWRIAELLAAVVLDLEEATSTLSRAERELVERFLARVADAFERQADRMLTEAEAAARAACDVPSPVLWG